MSITGDSPVLSGTVVYSRGGSSNSGIVRSTAAVPVAAARSSPLPSATAPLEREPALAVTKNTAEVSAALDTPLDEPLTPSSPQDAVAQRRRSRLLQGVIISSAVADATTHPLWSMPHALARQSSPALWGTTPPTTPRHGSLMIEGTGKGVKDSTSPTQCVAENHENSTPVAVEGGDVAAAPRPVTPVDPDFGALEMTTRTNSAGTPLLTALVDGAANLSLNRPDGPVVSHTPSDRHPWDTEMASPKLASVSSAKAMSSPLASDMATQLLSAPRRRGQADPQCSTSTEAARREQIELEMRMAASPAGKPLLLRGGFCCHFCGMPSETVRELELHLKLCEESFSRRVADIETHPLFVIRGYPVHSLLPQLLQRSRCSHDDAGGGVSEEFVLEYNTQALSLVSEGFCYCRGCGLTFAFGRIQRHMPSCPRHLKAFPECPIEIPVRIATSREREEAAAEEYERQQERVALYTEQQRLVGNFAWHSQHREGKPLSRTQRPSTSPRQRCSPGGRARHL